MSTTEKTNTDSTYSGNIKQDNRRTKQVKYPGRLFRKKEIFIAMCQAWQITPTLDMFATGENKLLDRFVAIGEEEEGAELLNAFLRPWKEEIFWIHPPNPKTGKALIAWEMFNPKSIMILPCSRYLTFGESSMIQIPGNEMRQKKDMLPPGKIAVFLMDQESNKEENQQQSFQTIQT
ncbi:MAG: hypothetical protein EZS28_015031 [Streblomastix strix]|uniref:Uncharacterized protein n=1 Tax=Streblomastix strix TaxID=222440 RepID=A0A5J4W3F0_9EUKA|nr:MAG: hypothetical protein EZS28_015031 [Streblomastix strix]